MRDEIPSTIFVRLPGGTSDWSRMSDSVYTFYYSRSGEQESII